MDVLNLTEEETTALGGVVRSYLSDLHTEISHTDDREFKIALKREQETVQSVLEKLDAVLVKPGC